MSDYKLIVLFEIFLQKSIRKMKLARFYLRQNLEPLGKVSLCVGSLPTGLESSKYRTLITDVLGKSKCMQAVHVLFQCFVILQNYCNLIC